MNEVKKKHRIIKIILPLLIIAVAVFALKMLGQFKPAPQRQAPPEQGLLVEVTAVHPTTHKVTITATGTVSAQQQINLIPQVSGKVNWISSRLVAGGHFWKGDLLLRLEAKDYELAIEQAKADVAQAEVALATEQEQARVARAEWDAVQFPGKGEPGPLVTHELQLLQQQASVAAARATLRKAELNLQRTEIRAPFNGRIREEQVDLGQYVNSGSTLAVFAGTDYAEIKVPMALADLHWLNIPGNSEEHGSTVTIKAPQYAATTWHGEITRSLGEIDPVSRMATLVVTVKNPYQLNLDNPSPPLPQGLFVELSLAGSPLEEVMVIPRRALRTGQVIWLADHSNRLVSRKVKVLHREQDTVIIDNVIAPDERLILTSLSGAADGALLRPVTSEDNRP